MKLLQNTGLTVLTLICAGTLFLASGPAALAEDAPAAVSSGKGDTSRFESLMPRAGGSNDAEISYGAPEPTSGDTHPTLKLTPDKSEMIRLDADATSVIIGSGEHLGAVAESSRLIVLVPRLPGATYLTILDAQGKVLMQRHVLVDAPKEKYVRIRRTCNTDAAGCEATTVYYCPDMCHRVGLVQPGADVVTQSAAATMQKPSAPGSSDSKGADTESKDTGGADTSGDGDSGQ